MADNYVLLERTELNASAASVTFANIPQTGYTDLKIVMSTRLDSASGANFNYITFNGVTTGYSVRTLEGSGSSASSANASTRNAGLDQGTSFTSNTFSNTEIYIPNYNSANNKSYSVETVTENNATSAFMEMVAGLWSNTAAITSIQITPDTGGRNYVANSTFSLYGIAALGTTPAIAPKADGGNIIDYDGTYWIHTFLTSGTFTPQVGLTCEYLVVAGGGGGGGNGGIGSGGGGAGGYRSSVSGENSGGGGSAEAALTLNASTPYTVTIGAGGTGGINNSAAPTVGVNSTFSSITSTGGGGGGSVFTGAWIAPTSGGSGGGGGAGSTSGASGTTNQGRAGGTGLGGAGIGGGGGGGGASTVGANAVSSIGGNGGNGVASTITGSSVTRAGGGGGGASTSGTGGTGGGGAGSGAANGTSGTVNAGGGGGGGNTTGGAGGSGIVIIRYPAA
jgi:hypothetical protein